jgi:hypothetical protein
MLRAEFEARLLHRVDELQTVLDVGDAAVRFDVADRGRGETGAAANTAGAASRSAARTRAESLRGCIRTFPWGGRSHGYRSRATRKSPSNRKS